MPYRNKIGRPNRFVLRIGCDTTCVVLYSRMSEMGGGSTGRRFDFMSAVSGLPEEQTSSEHVGTSQTFPTTEVARNSTTQ
jgi:hypothetical protein